MTEISEKNIMIESQPSRAPSKTSIFIKMVIVLAILAMAFFVAYYFISNPATTEKQETREKHNIIVKTRMIKLGTHPVKIEVMGQVIAARSATLKPRVQGEIIQVSDNFIPGGFFKAGDEILQIDSSDYTLAVNVQKAALRQSNAALKIELGQQTIAKEELQIIEQSTGNKLKSSDLALRKPQLEQARAMVSSAKANLDLAQLNLERTIIKAPFNGLIIQRNTDLGNIVSTQDTLATLVSTDEYWIDIEIPVHNLHWIEAPSTLTQKGSEALITLDSGRGTRKAHVLKIAGTLNQQSRLAKIILSAPDPLLLQKSAEKSSQETPLILGDYVHVTLLGTPLHKTARIPSAYLHNNNTLWLERDSKLVIQPVLIAYKDRNFSYITKGLRENDRIIISNITTPVNGMDVVVESDDISKTGGHK